ncbi:hypothetical protein EVAR_104026_1 [Eumeta japonica]|uniref:C2H2-type domain-containing protein n=1 Tax=Eumeta variegata TaxID=151549 RepID=A0A4C1Z8D5_EUMVA|nr:hypothetical protein EVAR_104026_1 [Eumeta japonica]
MIANLPLLFANGNPTALSKISGRELEKFITFMVTCSWGHDTAKDIRQPPWWPDDVVFSHPFRRPQEVSKDWEVKLKRLVRRCYDYHKSAFLLVFSSQLSRYPRNRLRYVDNRDHTTSLYYRPSGRLLVTFRNENLFYDRLHEPKGFLQTDSQLKSTDIYLCDNCDSHFDNLNLLKAHERLCNGEDVPSSTCNIELQDFLDALKLKPTNHKDDDSGLEVVEIKARQVRSTANVDRGPPYPFSSLAYMRNAKSNVQRDTSYSRDRIERYCCDTPLPNKTVSGNKTKNGHFPIRYRRPIDYWHRRHIFPNQRNKEILDLKGQLYWLKCRPLKVLVENMSVESIQAYIAQLKHDSLMKKECISDKDIEFVSENTCEQSMDSDPLKMVDPLNRTTDVNCEVIDLCSDDENPSVNENCDPRAGVTCVMRGGAVLRRTAVTPSALPAEPCGARQRPLFPAVLQPHPVILFTQSLSNLQTISLD